MTSNLTRRDWLRNSFHAMAAVVAVPVLGAVGEGVANAALPSPAQIRQWIMFANNVIQTIQNIGFITKIVQDQHKLTCDVDFVSRGKRWKCRIRGFGHSIVGN